MEKDAKVISNNGEYEVRCAGCGRLLLTFKNSENRVDKSARIGIMVTTRCPRSNCKVNNLLKL